MNAPVAKTLRMAAAVLVLPLVWVAGYVAGGGTFAGRRDAAAAGADAGAGRADDGRHRAGVPVRADAGGMFSSDRKQPWTRERLERAIASVRRDPSIIRAFRSAIRMADAMSEEDFPGVLEESAELTKRGDMAEVCKIIMLSRWMELNPRAAGDYMVTNKELGGFIDIPGELLAGAWAASDPAAGVRWGREHGQSDYAEKIFKALARRDPDEALAFAAAHSSGIKADEAARIVAENSWELGTPEEAARRLGALPESRNLFSVANRWAKENPADAVAWAASLADKEAREAALNGVISAWSAKDPAAACAWVLEREKSGVAFEGDLHNPVSAWMNSDIESTKRWAASLPGGESRKKVFATIAANLVEADPKACAAWLETLPQSPERDEAVARYSGGVVEKDPAAAVEWALTIGDSQKRTDRLRVLTAEWFKRDAGAAFSWLSESPQLSEDDRRAILEKK